MAEQAELHLKSVGERGKDIFLCHTGVDKPWVERLAQRIEAEPYQNRFLGVVFDKWDFAKGGNIVVDIEREIDVCRFVGVVVTRAMLGAEWPTMERSIAVWSDPAGTRGRVSPAERGFIRNPAIRPFSSQWEHRESPSTSVGICSVTHSQPFSLRTTRM
jgi:hypothetical protein